jgi:hypothetical protein
MSSRPWEITLFNNCALQDPWLTEVVLGPRGLPSILSALKLELSKTIPQYNEYWDYLEDIVYVLWILSPKFSVIIGSEPGIIDILLNLFRYLPPPQSQYFLLTMSMKATHTGEMVQTSNSYDAHYPQHSFPPASHAL